VKAISARPKELSLPVILGTVIVTDVRVGLSVPAPVQVPQSDLETSLQTAKAEVDRLSDLHSIIALEMAALNVLNVPARPIGENGKAPPTSPTAARVALANFKDEQQQLRIKEKRELDLQLRTATEHLADFCRGDLSPITLIE
jgi:hypothetical protein